MPPEIEHLDVKNTAKLKHVLFSGEPWLLQCYSGLPFAGQHLPAPFRLHPVFTESAGSMKGLVKAGTLDCEAKMPSNKTLISKFGLVRRTQPLLLYAGGGDRPADSGSERIRCTAHGGEAEGRGQGARRALPEAPPPTALAAAPASSPASTPTRSFWSSSPVSSARS